MLMSIRGACFAAVLCVLSAPVHAAVLFHETFDGPAGCVAVEGGPGPGTFPFPEGWLLRNVDLRDPQINYVNDAWIVRDDLSFATGCAAFSTSYYYPYGAADDWMWSPAVFIPSGTTVLSWRAAAYLSNYLDGYEVRVMVEPATPTGGPGVMGNQLTASTQLFAIAAEANAWTARSVDVSAYAEQTIRVAFRNASDDKYLLLIDDVRLEGFIQIDPRLQAPVDVLSGQYAKVPVSLGYPFNVQATASNGGDQPLTGVTVETNILLDGVPVQSATSAPVSLAPGASQMVQLASGTYSNIGVWSVEALVTAIEGDEALGNSARAVDLLEVTPDELTRANGIQAGVLGLGDAEGGELGNTFDLPGEAVLVGVRYTIDNYDAPANPSDPGSVGDGVGDFNGVLMRATIRSWDAVNNVPGGVLYTAGFTVPADAAIGPLVLDFPVDARQLPGGRYLVAAVEPAGRKLSLYQDAGRFTPGTTWIGTPVQPWTPVESLGAGFARPFRISALFAAPSVQPFARDDAFAVDLGGVLTASVAANDSLSDGGGHVFALVGNVDNGTLQLAGDGNFEYTADAIGTTSFTYSLCDAAGKCDQAMATIQVSAPIEAEVLLHETFSGCTAGIDGPGYGSYPFPDGWLLRDVDGRTPHEDVAYFDDAWEIRDDSKFEPGQCVASSTSSYAPDGAADDWMWTPAVAIPTGTTFLRWRAVAYDPDFPDGYEVRVMVEPNAPTGGTGAIGNQANTSTVVFSTAAEQDTWMPRSVNLSAYAGKSIHVGFRNNSNDRLLLLIDDVRIERLLNQVDPALRKLADVLSGQYVKVPAFLGFPFDVQATVANAGSHGLSGVTVEGDLMLDGVAVQAFTSPRLSMAAGTSQTLQVASGAYLQPGVWGIEAMVTATEGDAIPGNSAQAVSLLEATVAELTRANGSKVAEMGVSGGVGGELGSDFVLPSEAMLVGVRYTMNNYDLPVDPDDPASTGDGIGEFSGVVMQATVRAWDHVGNTPGGLLHTAQVTVPAGAPIGMLVLDFPVDRLPLAAGRYLVAAVQPVDRPLALFQDSGRFTPGTNWVLSPAQPWVPVEAYGPEYARPVRISALFQAPGQPPRAEDDAFSVAPESTLAGSVALNDLLSGAGGNVFALVSDVGSGSLLLAADGSFEYVPLGGITATTAFTYSLCDVLAQCDQATATIEVSSLVFRDSFETD